MRNPKRIKRICKLFEKIWEKLPDWRFCQLYVNMFGRGDNFYVEDKDIERVLQSWYKDVTRKPTKQDKIDSFQALIDLWGSVEKIPVCLKKSYEEEYKLWKEKYESDKTK